MVVRRALLRPVIDVGQHIDIGVRIVRQRAAADRRVVVEGLGDEVRIARAAPTASRRSAAAPCPAAGPKSAARDDPRRNRPACRPWRPPRLPAQASEGSAAAGRRLPRRLEPTIGWRKARWEERHAPDRTDCAAPRCSLAGGRLAMAQDNYPTGTVKFVLPSAPGSTTDILTRLTADALGRKWGKPTIVENIAGGSMNIGAGQVVPRGARRLHAVHRAAGADHAGSSAQQGHHLQSARLGADHDAGEDRQRAVGPHHACRVNTRPGADRLRQGQSRASSPSRPRARPRPRICRRRSSRW